MEIIIIIAIAVVVLIVTLSAILNRYKRCPSDKILVIYGKTGRNKNGGASSAKCIHGGASFIWPVFQSYAFLDLTPISIECNLTNALSKQNIRVDVPCRFTVGISTEPDNMTNAAERLLGLTIENIQNIATDILFGQLRLVIATMDIEEINSDRDKFLANVSTNVEAELRKIGLKLINVNVTDIRDESGYIEALGKEAAAKAINDAKKSVAEQNRFGEIGKAEADRDKDIRIAETVRDTRISTADANAKAVEGENNSKIAIANSDAVRREKEAEAARIAIAAEKVQAAMAMEEAYKAEQSAELARAAREQATQQEAWDKMQVEIYKRKTSLSDTVLSHMMADTTYMTGREAIDKGFADELIEDAEPTSIAASADGRSLFVNGRQMHLAPGMFAPDNIPTVTPEASAPEGTYTNQPEDTGNEGGVSMTLEELRAKYPDEIAQVEAAARASVDHTDAVNTAIQAERARMQEIDEV